MCPEQLLGGIGRNLAYNLTALKFADRLANQRFVKQLATPPCDGIVDGSGPNVNMASTPPAPLL